MALGSETESQTKKNVGGEKPNQLYIKRPRQGDSRPYFPIDTPPRLIRHHIITSNAIQKTWDQAVSNVVNQQDFSHLAAFRPLIIKMRENLSEYRTRLATQASPEDSLTGKASSTQRKGHASEIDKITEVKEARSFIDHFLSSFNEDGTVDGETLLKKPGKCNTNTDGFSRNALESFSRFLTNLPGNLVMGPNQKERGELGICDLQDPQDAFDKGATRVGVPKGEYQTLETTNEAISQYLRSAGQDIIQLNKAVAGLTKIAERHFPYLSQLNEVHLGSQQAHKVDEHVAIIKKRWYGVTMQGSNT